MKNYLGINGLTYFQEFIPEKKQQELIELIDGRPWSNELRRTTQQYGYKYVYTARKIDSSMNLGSLPDFAVNLAHKLRYCGLLSKIPDQLIINEYLPGQGIASHIDCVPCFEDEIATISLGSVYEMQLSQRGNIKNIDLGLGSCLVFNDDARYNWYHGIIHRKFDGERPRERRISLTFRKVILEK